MRERWRWVGEEGESDDDRGSILSIQHPPWSDSIIVEQRIVVTSHLLIYCRRSSWSPNDSYSIRSWGGGVMRFPMILNIREPWSDPRIRRRRSWRCGSRWWSWRMDSNHTDRYSRVSRSSLHSSRWGWSSMISRREMRDGDGSNTIMWMGIRSIRAVQTRRWSRGRSGISFDPRTIIQQIMMELPIDE